MLLPLLAAAGPGGPPRPGGDPTDPPTPREPESLPGEIEPPPGPPLEPPTPREPETEPPSEPTTTPAPEEVPPGVPFQEPEPEPDIPDGPGVSDPDLAKPAPAKAGGAPLSPPDNAPERRLPQRALALDRMDDEDGDTPYDTASLPPDHPAYDRIQARGPARPRKARSRRSRILGTATAVALVAAGLLITYVLLREEAAPADLPDLLTLAATHAEAVTLDVVTGDLDRAEAFIIGEFGWPIRVPVLPDTRLEGVGVEALVEGVEVPVLRYAREDGPPIVVYAYDYAFLDAAADHLSLGAAVYARLADTPPVDVRRVDDQYLVLWRRRSVIYTAVMPDDPAPLVEYLRRR